MAFFGLTYLDDYCMHEHPVTFHRIPVTHYERAFDAHVSNASQRAAQLLGVDQEAAVQRSCLGDILKTVLERIPTLTELETWFKFLNTPDSTGLLGRSTYMRAVEELKQFCEARDGNVAKDIRREASRVASAPPNAKFALRSTDITKGEGKSPAHYYGQLTLL